MLNAYSNKQIHATSSRRLALPGAAREFVSIDLKVSLFVMLTTLLSIILFTLLFPSGTQAEIYKYRKPNGKLLFTDTEILDNTYVLLNAHEIMTPSKGKREPLKYEGYIYRAAREYDVEASLIKAIIKTESDFDPNAKSKAGAEGLMQLMPETARMYNVHNSYNSEQNIMAGTRHIKYLLRKYKDDLILALAAYNAGESAVTKHNGVPPYPETQRYVEKVQTFKKQFENN